MTINTVFNILVGLCFVVSVLSVLVIRNYRKADNRLMALGDRYDSPLRKTFQRVLDIWSSVGLYSSLMGMIAIIIQLFVVK
jgi:hypothetical protein